MVTHGHHLIPLSHQIVKQKKQMDKSMTINGDHIIHARDERVVNSQCIVCIF